MKDILSEAGIKVTDKNKKAIDQAVHKIVGVKYKDCPYAWRKVKNMLDAKAERKKLVGELKKLF